MTRRRPWAHLWIVTTACCAVLALPTIAHLISMVIPVAAVQARARTLWDAVAVRATDVARSTPMLAAHGVRAITAVSHALSARSIGLPVPWRTGVPMALGVGAAILTLGGLAMRLVTRRRVPPSHRIHRLAKRGRGVSAIARHTGLSQDAVRQVLCPEPPRAQGPFANALAASLDASLRPASAYGRDR